MSELIAAGGLTHRLATGPLDMSIAAYWSKSAGGCDFTRGRLGEKRPIPALRRQVSDGVDLRVGRDQFERSTAPFAVDGLK